MESKKINQLATNVAPLSTDLTIIGDPTTGVLKKITLEQIAFLFAGKFLVRATYALMIADGTPTINTIYSITNDENKSYIRSTYLWKSDGNREWIASTPDN
jgi:hypothetical protein